MLYLQVFFCIAIFILINTVKQSTVSLSDVLLMLALTPSFVLCTETATRTWLVRSNRILSSFSISKNLGLFLLAIAIGLDVIAFLIVFV